MATSITLNGTSYDIPAVGEGDWGTDVSNYLIALATGVLTKTGGAFTLTAEADFGATYGLKSAYFKSRGTTSTTGILRLANTETVSWRDAANSADLPLTVSASDRLQFNSVNIPTISSTDTLTNKSLSDSTTYFIDESDATKKLQFQLSGITTSTTRTLTIPDASTTIVGTDASQTLTNKTINGSNNTITNVSLSTGITGTLGISNGGTGQTTANAALNALLPSQASNSGKILSTDGTDTSWIAAFSNPMTTTGDIVYSSDGSGTPARLAFGSANTVLKTGAGSTPSWGSIVNADVDGSAAIAGTKISPDFGSQNIETTGTLTVSGNTTLDGTGNSIKGRTGGSTISSGYIGEKFDFASRGVTITTGSSWSANSTSMGTLTAGVWLLFCSGEHGYNDANATNYRYAVATNGTDDSSGVIAVGADSGHISGASAGTNHHFVGYLNVSSSTSIYAKVYQESATGGVITVAGYAVRIA